MDIIESMKKELLRRNYSLRTIRTYEYCIKRFLRYYKKGIKKVTKKDIREFLEKLVEKNKTGNTINVYLNSLKFVFEELLGKRMRLNIRYSKKPLKLPVVLSKEEVYNLFNEIKNEKHNLMIKLMYSAGLRVSELINLRVRDLEFDKNYGWVRGGKGNKDRLFIIAEILKQEIKNLIEDEGLDYEDLLFKSNREKQYSLRSLQNIIKKSTKRVGIKKRVTPHTLRHSFATHLIEDGYDLISVQALLGHKSPETSMIYIHMASPKILNVKSPLDSLKNVDTNFKIQA